VLSLPVLVPGQEIDSSVYSSRWLIFQPFKDRTFFCVETAEGGPIGRPNAADVTPETLHEELFDADRQSRPEAPWVQALSGIPSRFSR